MTDNSEILNTRLKGIAVSQGIIIGKARFVDRSKQTIIYQYLINDDEVAREVERFKEALNSAREQIVSLKARMSEELKDHAFILDAHLMIMDDSMISESTINTILKEKINAEWALRKSVQNIRHLFEQIDYEYIRDRIRDVENVEDRILRNLSGKKVESLAEIEERVIIVAHDLSPGDTSELNTEKVKGFLTDVGGRTSHTAIMAQALKIPAVVGLESITSAVEDGVLIIVDGYTGEVIVNPDDETIIAYGKKQEKIERFRSSILRSSHLPAVTVDGYKTTILANIELIEEISAAKEYGAEGVGLYRTEFLYIRSRGVPDEEELFTDYREVAQMVSPEIVTIRTLDLGGDKFASRMDMAGQINPALGLRAIRLCLKETGIFKSQLRAILRASAFGKIRLMFPMISGVQELLAAKEILSEVMDELDKKGMEYDRNIRVGAMIEVPSAVIVADLLARHADFFSIGTNDLIQYSLAIDRGNEHVAYMYEPYHPAVIRMIDQVVKSAKDAGIDVSLCGEMAGDPFCASILLGIGIDELSMNLLKIPLLKKVIRSIYREEAVKDLQEILRLSTAKEVRMFIEEKFRPMLEDLKEEDLYVKTAISGMLN
ncbi:MAG: phosphoenolpyruvate--protein phosphotransferase [Deltaproteobacteria bacterium]|nr:phosphoenolpyruvate--protein phosphotransferase [Deltaproteobacteria bacterium]